MAKINWEKIRIEYETKGISQRKLCDKHGISFSTLSKRANREKWKAGKDEVETVVRKKVATKLLDTFAERKSDVIVASFVSELQCAEMINALVQEALQDPRQFYKHVVEETSQSLETITVTTAAGNPSEKAFKVDTTTAIGKDLGILDARRLKDLTSALTAATELQRMLKGILTVQESERLAIAREQLELEKVKAGGNDDKVVNIYSNIPPEDPEPERDEEDQDE